MKFILDDREFLIILGGDCSILFGVFGAFALADMSVGLMMLDGHTDYRSGSPCSIETGGDLETCYSDGHIVKLQISHAEINNSWLGENWSL